MKIVLISCPQWSVLYPPYNISLISSILKKERHDVKIIDLNIECYHHLLKTTGENYWEGRNYFYWSRFYFKDHLLPKIETLLDKTVNEIIKFDPEYVGFSIYGTNIECVSVLIKKIKESNPVIKIMSGGPESFHIDDGRRKFLGIDLLFTGEADNILNKAISEYPLNKIYKDETPTDLNTLPFADYDDYDLSQYIEPQSISMESSRGCIAKCSFCMETCFWKYRSKNPDVILKELKYYKNKYNIKHARFNDSLVNGNIKEFKNFIHKLAEEKFKVTWGGYIRIDKRMDNDFFKKMKESGANFLSFGVESGSQKVLNDMRKGIKIEEIEQNLNDSKEYNLQSQINWIIGFPTETYIDYFLSLIFVYNNRKNIWQICPGMTCGIGPKSDLMLNPDRYDISKNYTFGGFVTKDGRNTIIHRFIRLKLFHIFLDILNISNGQYHSNIKNDYSFKGEINDIRLDYNNTLDFSYLIDSHLESSILCEYMSFFFALSKISNPFEIRIKFNHELDRKEFGNNIVRPYNSDFKFKIDKNLNWILIGNHSLVEGDSFNKNIHLNGIFDYEE